MRGPISPTLLDRLVEKIDFTQSDCWLWVGGTDPEGYGNFYVGPEQRAAIAHRVVYEVLVGEVPANLDLDHLCRNHSCVNPAHLDPVSHAENMMRGLGFGSENAAKTHCIHGHEFSAANTIRRLNGRRSCRACMNASQRRYQARKRQVA